MNRQVIQMSSKHRINTFLKSAKLKSLFSIIGFMFFFLSYSQEKEIHFQHALVYDYDNRWPIVIYVADKLNRSNIAIESATQEGAPHNLLQDYDYTLKQKKVAYPLKINKQRKAIITKPKSTFFSEKTGINFNSIKKENRTDTVLHLSGTWYLLTDSVTPLSDKLFVCIAENYPINNTSTLFSSFYVIKGNLPDGLILKVTRENSRSEMIPVYELNQIENINEVVTIDVTKEITQYNKLLKEGLKSGKIEEYAKPGLVNDGIKIKE